MRSLTRALIRRLHRWTAGSRWETRRILGHELELREGTVRSTPDYDDAWFLACARRARQIFDVGANVGYDAVMACLAGRVERLALIEPNPRALSVAADNLIRHGWSPRAHFVPAFASDAAGERVELWTTGEGAAGSADAGLAVTAARRGESMEVTTTTVDELCSALGFAPDLVKIDVEGAEARVLAGSERLAARCEARFLVEMHASPSLSMVDNAGLVLDWCGRMGYAAWYLKYATRLDDPDPIAQRGRCHLLLQPADREYPPWLEGIEQGAPLERAMEEAKPEG